MEAAYWIRQPLQPSAKLLKRQRTESDVATGAYIGQEAQIFQPRSQHGSIQPINDTQALGASYDHYLQEKQKLSSYGSQVGPIGVSGSTGREIYGLRGGKSGFSYQDPAMLADPTFKSLGLPKLVENSNMNLGFGIQTIVDPMVRPVVNEREIPLPPEASCTLFVEGLPRDAAEREVAHIFRPFLGYKDVRLVKKEPKYDGGSPVLLCFVDFTTPSYAMAAMGAIEGYKMDLHDPDSSALRLQFATPKPNQGFHGRRR
ncbi:RNA-binding protein 2-like [Phalaenopsis equestris]|uniref:RNA-binding protein 2-like n=1 Tax=Phalaenopsis equestris TaxID=78828 RepID=UPI0009E641A2|nr:RNA-binding protein 2-like [Phalaenopsis equestris]